MSETHTQLTDVVVTALAAGAILSKPPDGCIGHSYVDVAALTLLEGRVPLGDHATVILRLAKDLREARRLLRAVEDAWDSPYQDPIGWAIEALCAYNAACEEKGEGT